LYNNLNDSSISLENEKKYGIDYRIIKNYDEFKHLEMKLGKKWDLSCMNYEQLERPFKYEKSNIIDNNNNTYNINTEDLKRDRNYIYCKDFGNDIVSKYYNICMKNIEKYLFKKKDVDRGYKLCDFLIKNHIHDRKLYIYMAICYYYLDDIKEMINYMNKSDYMKYKYKELMDIYNKSLNI
jgi:hypothetical protein